MISTIYNVITRYSVDDRATAPAARAARQADGLAKSLENVERRAEGAGGSLRNMLSGLAGAGGLGLLATIGSHVGKMQSEAENAQIAIASAFSINKVLPFNKGMERAAKLMEDFKKKAKNSPGETRDFTSIFQATAPQTAKLGLSDEQLTTFAARGVGAAFTIGGGDVKTTGGQLAQILQGQGGADNNIFQALRTPLLEAAGIEEKDASKAVEAFNKLAANNPAKVFDALMKSLESLDEANKAFGKTFTGMWGSFKDTVNGFLSGAFAPLSKRGNELFSKFLELLEYNERAIDRWRDKIGGGLVSALNMVLDVSGQLLNNWQALALLGSALAVPKLAGLAASGAGALAAPVSAYASRTVGLAGAALSGGGAMLGRGAGALRSAGGAALSGALALPGHLLWGDTFGGSQTRSARLARGIRAAPAAIAGAGRAAYNFSAIDAMRAYDARKAAGGRGVMSVLGGAGSTALGAGAGGLKMLTVALAKFAVVLAPLIVIGLGVAGVFEQMKNKSSEARAYLMLSMSELRIQLDMLFKQLGMGGGAGEAFAKIKAALGEGFIGVAGMAVKAIEQIVWGLNQMIVVAKAFGYGIGNIMENYDRTGAYALTPGGIKDAFSYGYKEAEMEYKSAERAAYEADVKRKRDDAKTASDDEYSRLADAAIEKAATAAAGTIGDTTITIQNSIKVETNADADRIAFRVGEVTAASVYEARTSAIVPRGFGG